MSWKLSATWAALMLLVLSPGAVARAELHARAQGAVSTGAGYSSDLFLGANLGPSAEGQVAPSLRLDLSLSPAIKLWTAYDFAFGAYELTRSNSLDHAIEVGSRLRIAKRLLAELSGNFQAQSLSVAQAIDEQTGLVASESSGLGLVPALRYQSPSLSAAALYSFASQSHLLEGGEHIDDLQHLGLVSIGLPLGPVWTSLSARGLREQSSAPEFSYWGASLHAALAYSPWSPLTLRLSASVHRNSFDGDRRDLLVKAGLSPTFELTDYLDLEAAYGYAKNISNNEELSASRHYVYLGLRAEGDLWRR